MPKDRPPTYTPAPELPHDPLLRRRFAEIIAVLAQTQTVTGAATSLSLSRNHFQTILHRVIAAMIDAMTPKPAGRPAKPAREAELEAENTRLRAENESLRTRTEAIERMLSVVGGIASGKTSLPRSRKKKTKSEDPEPAPIRRLAVKAMREQGATTAVCVAALGVSESTVRRCGAMAIPPTCRPRAHDPAKCDRVRSVVRDTHGLVGASGLGRMSGLPRRLCAALKRQELRALELERKARCARVTIVEPGVVRGFDAMYVDSTAGMRYWLVAADAAVPYRTSLATVTSYDAVHVIRALAEDFESNGAPFVIRIDRIACQRTPEVEAFLARHQVLVLHGPPRHPYYYGQLERQNREHRAWLGGLGLVSPEELATAGEAMRTSLNALWPRPTLDGWTAEQAWRARRPLDIDRRELIAEVTSRASQLAINGIERLRAQRFAIESALTTRGLLIINQGEQR